MNLLANFERKIGGRWTGIIFHRDNVPTDHLASRPMRFCEAIKESGTGPITLTKENTNCPGAMRSFGWELNGGGRLVEDMAEKYNLTKDVAAELVKRVPSFNGDIKALTIGSYESPEVVVSYAQPKAAMRVVSQWQKLVGIDLDVSISSVMGVCGCVTAGAFITGGICVSFGCPESRVFGGIGNDRLIIGLPANTLVHFGEHKWAPIK